MQFISDRESLAEQFALQTQKSSSYMLSSRNSRRKIVYEQSLEEAQQQIQQFKSQIQARFVDSISNKIYTFPLKFVDENMFQDSEFKYLEKANEFNLYQQNQMGQPKMQFKITNKKIKNQKVQNVLNTLKNMKQNIITLALDCQQQFYKSTSTKPTTKISTKKSYQSKAETSYLLQKEKQKKKIYGSIQFSEDIMQKRLKTQPYQKPMGFIIKKK